MRKLIRRGDFTSKQDLRTKIGQFIAYFNANHGKDLPMGHDSKTIDRLNENESVIFVGMN